MRADPDQAHHEDSLDTSAAMRTSVFEESGHSSRHSSSCSPTHDYSRKSPLTVRTRTTTTPLSSCSNSPPPPPTSSSNSGNNNTPLLTASLNAPPQSYYSTVRVKSDLQAQLAKAQQQQQQQQQHVGKKFKSEEQQPAAGQPQQPSEVSQSLSKAGGGSSRSSSPYHQNHQAQTAFYSSLLQQLRQQQADPAKGTDSTQPAFHPLKVKNRARIFKLLRGPVRLPYSYTRFLAPIDCLKIPAQSAGHDS
jgi:hypothetical protein